MKQLPSKQTLSFVEQAREAIFSQRGLLISIRRSAWWLFQHEMTRTDPHTGQFYTPRKALENTLNWMADQAEVLERVKQEPTQMQRRLLQMLAEGKTPKQIAYELGKNARTLRVHFSHIRSRLGVETMYQVMAVAVKKGWVSVSRHERAEKRNRAG